MSNTFFQVDKIFSWFSRIPFPPSYGPVYVFSYLVECRLRGFHDYWDQLISGHSFETIYLRPHSFQTTTFETRFIWNLFIRDHFIWDYVLLRPVHLRLRSFETFSFETTFIWDYSHLRPHSFETTFIWDHIHLRPHLFETTFIWDHIHLRPHSVETTFIWDHIHFRSHSFYAMLKWSCFDLLWITFLWYTFHLFVGDLKFCKVTTHLKICKVTPFRVQGWLTLDCKCTLTQGRINGRGQRGQLPRAPAYKGASVMTIICF